MILKKVQKLEMIWVGSGFLFIPLSLEIQIGNERACITDTTYRVEM